MSVAGLLNVNAGLFMYMFDPFVRPTLHLVIYYAFDCIYKLVGICVVCFCVLSFQQQLSDHTSPLTIAPILLYEVKYHGSRGMEVVELFRGHGSQMTRDC